MLLEQFNWRREVVQADGPVVVDFWAPWCGPCRMMTPAIESLARDFKFCKVNIDSNPELAQHCGVSAVPTLLIVKGGKVVARHEGVVSEADLRATLRRFGQDDGP